MNNVPNLRFQEFSDEWNLIKLGDRCILLGWTSIQQIETNDGIIIS